VWTRLTYVEKGSPLARLAIREVWPIHYVIGWFAKALTRCSEHYGLKSMTTEVDVNDSPVWSYGVRVSIKNNITELSSIWKLTKSMAGRHVEWKRNKRVHRTRIISGHHPILMIEEIVQVIKNCTWIHIVFLSTSTFLAVIKLHWIFQEKIGFEEVIEFTSNIGII